MKNRENEELLAIEEYIKRHPGGIGIEALLSNDHLHIPRRTLQRRLSQLITESRLISNGKGRARRYAIPGSEFCGDIIAPMPQIKASMESYVPVSAEGLKIKVYVRQSKQQRRPIGYQLTFLENYRPNETYYLPKKLRTQLSTIGQSSITEQPAGTFARDILNRLLIDLSWASSNLEGNTYNRLDTERLLEFGQAADGKNASETQMILNHKSAIEFLVNGADQVSFNRYTFLSLHALLSDGLLHNPMDGGRLRSRPVEIGGSVYLPIALPQRIEELFDIILSMTDEISDPFEQSFFIMVHLPYLQPFIDVNKRVSRLAANIPFIKRNLCPLSFLDVPQQAYTDAILWVYELNRTELLQDVFSWAYERSCQQYVAVESQLKPPDPFRLRYRQVISHVVQAIVRKLELPSEQTIIAEINQSVPEDEVERFVQTVLAEFDHLHEGNAIRFGLRPLEYDAWKEAIRKR